MRTFLIDLLICPSCQEELSWHVTEQHGDEIERADARCTTCGATYPVREGVGAFLTPELQRDDLWEQGESGLARHLREQPDTERLLLDGPLTELNPADRFFRGYVLEERGRLDEAEGAFASARSELYTTETRDCQQQLLSVLVACLREVRGPIIDIASGRCFLVEQMARSLSQALVATDFSPTALRRDKQRFARLGLAAKVDFVAVDARRTPFRAATLPRMTTYLGLPNIEDAGTALHELRRIAVGSLLAVTVFYPPHDDVNISAIRQRGTSLLTKTEMLDQLHRAGWEVTILKTCHAHTEPTPVSHLLEGATIDSLPAVDTSLEWALLEAR